MASNNDLIKQRENTRMSEMSAIKKERYRQADERLKLMSDMMQRRDPEGDNLLIDQMTTMQDLTHAGVKAIVSQTAATTAVRNQRLWRSTPPAQVTYRKIAQPSGEQMMKPPKLIPPATHEKDSTMASKMARVMHAESRGAGTDPMTDVSSIDPFTRGATTTGDNYSAVSGMTTQKSAYQTALTSAITNPPRSTFKDIIPRPVATSTQRKVNSKANIGLEQDETEDASEMRTKPQTRQGLNDDKH